MPSSVTVDDDLRRKIKKLAAELDTSQGEIVSRAIALFEKEIGFESNTPNPKARKIMRKAAVKRKNISWRKEIRKALKKPGLTVDDVRITSWEALDED